MARLTREQDEQYIRERHRQAMARLQARAGALESPLEIDISKLTQTQANLTTTNRQPPASTGSSSELYAAAVKSGLLSQSVDPNGQASKEAFFNQD